MDREKRLNSTSHDAFFFACTVLSLYLLKDVFVYWLFNNNKYQIILSWGLSVLIVLPTVYLLSRNMENRFERLGDMLYFGLLLSLVYILANIFQYSLFNDIKYRSILSHGLSLIIVLFIIYLFPKIKQLFFKIKH